ncbi:MAG: HDIG domain-containing protein [Lentisphaerae bacterium]|nr:HDIG domain-containing protein [Lentisphaerota bacterium]
MKKFLKFFSFRSGRAISDRHLLRGTPMEERLDISPAPWILAMVLVWLTASVLLILSATHAHSAGGVTLNSAALQDFRSLADFEYANRSENEKSKKKLLENVPVFCRIVPQRTMTIQRDLADLFSCAEKRLRLTAEKSKYTPVKGSLASELAAKMSPALLEELNIIARNNLSYENFRILWRRLLNTGILSVSLRESCKVSTPIRTIDSLNRINAVMRAGDMSDTREAARQLSELLFPKGGNLAREFTKVLETIFGSGNLQLDTKMREAACEAVLKNFRPQTRHIRRGEILIKRGEVVTPELLELAAAAERSIPPELHPVVFYRAALSLALMAMTIFFLYRSYPELVRDNRKIMLTAAVICISLLSNYIALKVFHSSVAARISNPVTAVSLQLFLPVSLCAIMLTVLVSYRVAMCASLFTIAITVLMLSPAHPYEMTLRYLILAALTGLLVRKVTNYRTFFVRSFIATGLIVLILHCDLLMTESRSIREFAEVGTVVGISAFGAAVVALVLIFLFELVFNVSTDMSLMVLCNYNHPLLERMKREAPGTMFHSMTVATLAEDAAQAIGANPLKAKAAALFHDIGKLEKARYFIENNHHSDELHRVLTPVQSAQIILGHVVEGLRLARTHRLSHLIRNAIRSHHGDTLVYFFYAKAKAENPDTPVSDTIFRYGGFPPREKELTILSLADACEAAVRSLDHPKPETIRQKVEEIFQGRLRENQLRNSLLTLKELDRVKESFITTLISIHHGRIAYTAESINEAAAQQMEQPASSGTAPEKP